MPTYVYRDDGGHTHEVVQAITDEPLRHIRTTYGTLLPVKRIPQPPLVSLKGSGFYRTGG